MGNDAGSEREAARRSFEMIVSTQPTRQVDSCRSRALFLFGAVALKPSCTMRRIIADDGN